MILALSWLTVFPVPAQMSVTARQRALAIALAPLVVGLTLGGIATSVLFGLRWLGLPNLVGGLLTVALLALLTRGMHLDGLADTVDGLGSYGTPERTLAVMKDPSTGAFGVIALILTIGLQAASLAVCTQWTVVVLSTVAGRVAFVWGCRRGVPAARPDGFGALVAGTQPIWLAPLYWAALAAGSTVVWSWRGALAVALAAGATVLLAWHTRRRTGGVTGDILGACCEVATTTALVACAGA
ncbi:adenosylcobinamide-GDP ribazoletransferase [Pseudonocardiaceae bacterium YIM PH 21723]|nr:adenosylcobinamide-GDP ribazoletransferase [Pseudonocardiaceae bacterium YIM PH 21723]